jgi:hypothetical protein
MHLVKREIVAKGTAKMAARVTSLESNERADSRRNCHSSNSTKKNSGDRPQERRASQA